MTDRDQGVSPEAALAELAGNLRWAWHPEARAIFRDMAPQRFAELLNSPAALLAESPAMPEGVGERALALREDLLGHLRDDHTWADVEAHALRSRPVVYFSMEFGLHESIRTYAGGLGVLAGDHLKSASDLGVPLVAVGLLYREGYFHQELDGSGWQVESYPHADPSLMPIRPACHPRDGREIRVQVETTTGTISAKVWEMQVGRVRLLLLDADVESNSEEDRWLTSRLYGGDRRTRIRQELLLGVGGIRAVDALGITPSVLHLNEGHCAFAALELTRLWMKAEGLGFAQASQRVARQTVFTTHTPVPAGHDRFDPESVEEHLGRLRAHLGIDEDSLMRLGRVVPDDEEERFCMTVLALKMSHRANGVSNLHGRVSRQMWQRLWPDRPLHDVPIGHVTNGVHAPTWMATRMQALMARVAGSDWIDRQIDPATWAAIDRVGDEELWATHQQCKRDLIAFARERSVVAARRRGEPQHVISALEGALSEDTMLVGFARRFATYKRATLALSDWDAIDRIVNHAECPVTFVFAGKAHPRDDGGKRMLQQVFEASRDPRFLGKVVVLEGYDMEVGRRLTQGVDVWLNNPRRPLEASGTSGQKVVLNGGLNCSVLDGWWAEAWDGQNGFAIGRGFAHRRVGVQDQRDFEDLMDVLPREVVPLYYRRGDGDAGPLPYEWIRRMKRSIRTLAWRFNSDRMVADYVLQRYLPAAGLVASGVGGSFP